jgi:hypothetical protein
MGTHDISQGTEAKRQKLVWLKKHNIPYKANFVRNKEEKAEYATPKSILIDDSIGCITPFNKAGGNGILHLDRHMDATLLRLDNIILQFKAMDQLAKI